MVVALTVAAVLLAIAIVTASEALEERRAMAAAIDLQLATITVAAADALVDLGQPVASNDLALSVQRLNADHTLALHALDPDEQLEAEALLDDIARYGVLLLTPSDNGRAQPLDHRRVEGLLATASSRAAAHAAEAEAQRTILLALVAVSLTVAGWMVVRTRSRSAQRRAAEDVELQAGRRVERLLNDSPDIFLVVGPEGRITYRSVSATRLLAPGYRDKSDLLALVAESERRTLAQHLELSHADGLSRTFELVDCDGKAGWFELRVSDLSDDAVVNGHLITARDVTNEVNLRHDLFIQANTDMLTGLPNRRVLDRVLDDASSGLGHAGGAAALISLDLDGFKDVNDTLGHEAGDDLLTQVAQRLREATRAGDVLLRLGGDEFAVILPTVEEPAEAEIVAERYLRVLDRPVRLGSRLEQLRTSVGVATTFDPRHVRALVSEADIAMYVAKRAGGSRIAVFDPSMENEAVASSQISRALRTADYDTEFTVVYQPIVTVDGNCLAGLEALLRWNSPTLGSVPPDEFIPMAERTGDICTIGEWVLDTVCRQIQAWERQGMDPSISVSVNVSPHQLAHSDFVTSVLATAEAWSVPTTRLTVEITESAVLDHTGIAVQRLHELRAAGVRISIDDFGSGYSNLGQLLRVPFNVLKIDRSLLITLSEMRALAGDDPTGPCAIMEAVASIASVFQAPVVCEGVESEQQRVSLAASGITHVQGYLTGRPAPPDQVVQLFPLLAAGSTR